MNPYYPPPAGPPPSIHRSPWLAIVGGVVGTLGILTLCAVVFLHPNLGGGPPIALATAVPSPTAPAPTAAPLATATAVSTAAPAPSDTPAAAASVTPTPSDTPATAATASTTPATLASPTASDTPAAGASPTVTDTPASGASPTATDTPPAAPSTTATDTAVPGASPTPSSTGSGAETSTFRLLLPPGWSVTNTGKVDISLAYAGANGDTGSLYLVSGSLTDPAVQQSLANGPIEQVYTLHPDTHPCPNVTYLSLIVGGVPATAVVLCYTETPQSGASYPAAAILWGTTGGGGTTYDLLATSAEDNKLFWSQSGPLAEILQTVYWKTR